MPPRPDRHLRVPGAEEPVRVIVDQPPQYVIALDVDARARLAEPVGARRIEAGQVERAQRAPGRGHPGGCALERAAMKIPVRDTPTRVAEDRDRAEQQRRAVQRVGPGLAAGHGLAPPAGERTTRLRRADRQLAGAVEATSRDLLLIRVPAVVGHRLHQARHQSRSVQACELHQLAEGAHDVEAWLEQEDDVGARVQQVLDQPRAHRLGQLLRLLGQELAVVTGKLAPRKALEWLVPERIVDVEDEDHKSNVGVVLRQPAGQHASPREVAGGNHGRGDRHLRARLARKRGALSLRAILARREPAPANPAEPIGAARSDVVVCVPVFGARSLFEQCLRSVVQHTEGVTVLVADDASADPGIAEHVRNLAEEVEALDLVYALQPYNVGFVRNMNSAFAATAPADIVILNSDVVVPARWLERLRDAANSNALIATASTLTNNGTILSVPHRDSPSPDPPHGLSLEEADRRIAAGSPRLHPRVPTGIGHCLYIRRSALDLVGHFDESFSPGYGEEVDFSQRYLARGLSRVVADDLYVFHRGAGSFGAATNVRQGEHEEILRGRYPYYHRAVRDAEVSETIPLARSLSAARLSLGELSVTIDGASLGPHVTGTQLHTLELVGALVRHGGARLRVRVPRTIGETARTALDELGWSGSSTTRSIS